MKIPKPLRSVRYTLAGINGLFLLTGLLLLAAGVAILIKFSLYSEFTTKRFESLPNFTIAVGVIIFAVSVMGFYGAISEKFYVIAAYTILLVVVLVFEVAIVIAGFGLVSDTTSEISSPMSQTIPFYESRREIAQLWDDMQMEYQCCGVAGRHDWVSVRLPVSCCFIDYGTVSPFECTLEKAYTNGCASTLGNALSYQAQVLALSASAALALQILITAVSGWLAWRVKFDEVELEH